MEIEIDISEEENAEAVVMGYGDTNNVVHIADVEITMNDEQFDALVAAIDEWREETATNGE